MTDSDEDGFQGTAESSWRRWVVQQITGIKTRLDELLRRHDALNDKLDNMDVEVQADPRRARMGDQLDRLEEGDDGRPRTALGSVTYFARWVFSDIRNVVKVLAFVFALAALIFFLGWDSIIGARLPLLVAPYSLPRLLFLQDHVQREEDEGAQQKHDRLLSAPPGEEGAPLNPLAEARVIAAGGVDVANACRRHAAQAVQFCVHGELPSTHVRTKLLAVLAVVAVGMGLFP